MLAELAVLFLFNNPLLIATLFSQGARLSLCLAPLAFLLMVEYGTYRHMDEALDLRLQLRTASGLSFLLDVVLFGAVAYHYFSRFLTPTLFELDFGGEIWPLALVIVKLLLNVVGSSVRMGLLWRRGHAQDQLAIYLRHALNTGLTLTVLLLSAFRHFWFVPVYMGAVNLLQYGYLFSQAKRAQHTLAAEPSLQQELQ